MGKAPDCYLNTRQAAALLGLSRRTLESYRVKGGGPPFLTYCNCIRYLLSDLDRWAAVERRRSTSDDGAAGADFLEEADREATTCDDAVCEGSAAGGHLSPVELASLLGVSRRTLARYRFRGAGPAFETADGQVRYPRAGVEAWLVRYRRRSTSDPGEIPPGDCPASPEEDE